MSCILQSVVVCWLNRLPWYFAYHLISKDLILLKVIITHQVLQIPYGLGSHTVSDEMDLPLAAPATWYSIWISNDLVIFYLPQESGFINLLLQMFFTIVLVSINSSHKIWAIIICTDTCLLLESIYSYQLLMQLACSVMKATKWINNSYINIPVWLNALLQRI